MRVDDFDFELPQELIAQTPAPTRRQSRLLTVRRSDGTIGHGDFSALLEEMTAGDLLVLNSTRVRHARLLGTRPSGAPAEVLLIHPGADGTWVAMGKPGHALRPGKRIILGDGIEIETVEVLDGPNRLVRFVGGTAEAAMAQFGRLPLPPYIAREPDATDEDRYQTVFADREGSVAAPTAGLHFDWPLLSALEAAGIRVEYLDLEVGPGTFRPVEVEDPREHPTDPEQFRIPEHLAAAVGDTRAAGKAVWAVGTTVVRSLEAAADEQGAIRSGEQETNLLILPGYRFKTVDRLITNFHLPRSTLFMLVSAFGGSELVLRAYQTAIAHRYRFYSYGDAMLIG